MKLTAHDIPESVWRKRAIAKGMPRSTMDMRRRRGLKGPQLLEPSMTFAEMGEQHGRRSYQRSISVTEPDAPGWAGVTRRAVVKAGGVRQLAKLLGCHPSLVGKWVHRRSEPAERWRHALLEVSGEANRP